MPKTTNGKKGKSIREKVKGELGHKAAPHWRRDDLLPGAETVAQTTVLDEPTPEPTNHTPYSDHDVAILKRAREAAVKVVNRLQTDLGSLQLSELIANGAEARLDELGAWLNRRDRPDLPGGLRELTLCGMVLHAKKLKQKRADAEKMSCSADVLVAFDRDLAHLDDLHHTVKGQLTFDWHEAIASGEE